MPVAHLLITSVLSSMQGKGLQPPGSLQGKKTSSGVEESWILSIRF